ncbi:MAG: ABC transporter ATP-binding protein [Clostridiales bacterium]|nr:ABC transporter ATP-binding protein [Clostridiales bacterium]
MELSYHNITKQFGSKRAVDSISAVLSPGIYGLLGANGAGKTTLMRMTCAVLNPSQGEIRLDGQPIVAMGERYRCLLGYLPQDFGYYPDFTAREFLLYIACIKGLSKSDARKRTQQLLELVGLSEAGKKKIRTFSGGMKQRLGIAQAVLNDPQILVLDEPTAGLDPKERVRFRNLIADLAKDKIVILSTHIVSDVEYIADTILMMKDGAFLLNRPIATVTDEIEGKVWSCTVSRQQADAFGSRFCIVSLHHRGSDAQLRIVSDEKPADHAQPLRPTLEDLYLYHFQDVMQGGAAS